MGYHQYEAQLYDHVTREPIVDTGGVVYVATAGDPAKATLYSDKEGSSQANPMSISNGRIRFFTADTVDSVDLYIQAPNGHFVVISGFSPFSPQSIYIDQGQRYQVYKIPFDVAHQTADNTETDTGFDEPAGGFVLGQGVGILVDTADATETIDVGDDGATTNDPNGYCAAVSVATTGFTKATLASGGQTLGALLSADEDGAGALVPEGHRVANTPEDITWTLSAGADTAKGWIILPILLTANV